MEIEIKAASYNLEKYQGILDKYNFKDGKITLNSIEDIVNLTAELKQAIMIEKYFDDTEANLLIYDDYIE